jgi:hypothetical protein
MASFWKEPFTKYKQFIDNCFKALPRQALHAKSLLLGFVHPTTGEMMCFDTELPQDFQGLHWEKLDAQSEEE